jgi:hypothetical protein
MDEIADRILMATCGQCWADPGERCLETATLFGCHHVGGQWFHEGRLRRAHRKGILPTPEYVKLLFPLEMP